ncbi:MULTISPECIES: ribosome biogenesis factor YjgA [Nitrincola]|uniref:Dual-action ribosomal maturation protein DarP n=1 Tax=Nitrincola nitratireducens TaxID=1229521 RepID=W9UZN5_9GAMM|nr:MULTISPECIES: ribosome biogenesis factor YjgA [Nitrincola]EXJ12713.1 hypothetical protein D791_00054 [Nitrincola nitratireducens]
MSKTDRLISLQEGTESEEISRSEVKRQMEALQELGKRITELRPDQQALVPMDDILRKAIEETRKISANGALRRHFQYIGKLMRKADADAIKIALNQFDTSRNEHNQKFHALEVWRDRLLTDTDKSLTDYIREFPEADIQKLRQLIRNTLKEQAMGAAPANYRKLFKFIRETAEAQDNA